MKPEIFIQNVWSEGDLIEIEISVCNGRALFINNVYIKKQQLLDLVNLLNALKSHYEGGVTDILLGAFGREYALGAFFARLHFFKPGSVYIETHQQSEHFVFKEREEACEAKMYLQTESSQLDDFIEELVMLINGRNRGATLVCT